MELLRRDTVAMQIGTLICQRILHLLLQAVLVFVIFFILRHLEYRSN